LGRDRFDRELEEEMKFHLEMKAQENLDVGMTADEAHYAAQRQFGNQALLQEVSREMWGVRSIETFFQDLRFGVRMLLKSKAFTAVAVLSLALGIGANTAIFSLIDAVLLKMLPVERPEQLYFIQNVGPRQPNGGAPPYPCFERFRDQNQSFTGMAAFSGMDPRLKIDGQIEEVRGQRVSGNYFSLLGVKAVLGRTLSPADDAVPGTGGPDGLVAVISYNYWTRRFGRDPAVIGKVVQLGNNPVMIIGVTQPEFYGLVPGREVNISLPMMVVGADILTEKTSWWFQAARSLNRRAPNSTRSSSPT
jgi:putative ABC transport system permease protein